MKFWSRHALEDLRPDIDYTIQKRHVLLHHCMLCYSYVHRRRYFNPTLPSVMRCLQELSSKIDPFGEPLLLQRLLDSKQLPEWGQEPPAPDLGGSYNILRNDFEQRYPMTGSQVPGRSF